MSQTQRAVTEYLHSELIHSLGAYRATVNQLEILLAADPIEPLREVLDAAHKFNVQLHECRNHPDKALRHPIPERLPISGHTWGLDAAAPGRHWPDVLRRSDAVHRHKWLEPLDCVKYYDAAILAFTRRLDDYGDGDGAGEEAVDRAAEQFSDCLTARDPYVLEGHGIARRVLRARLVRYERRRESAVALLSRGHQMTTPPAESLLALREGSFQQPEDQSIPWFVIKAQAEAHLAMHVVEGIKSQPFGGIAALDAAAHDWLRDHLERCIVLKTFVYSVSRAAPWIFAEDDAERRWVYDNHATAFESVSPTRCMWIATQLALLSLSRRAFAYSLLPDRERAFNDYQKLQRLVRDTERRIQRTPVHVVGAPEFLVAVSSQAHQHAGEIYRAEHAHTRALDQFRAASL